MKKKALLSSILTIALCLCLIAGSTYALFTSSTKVNVIATAGKVDVTATLDGNIEKGSSLGNMLPETSIEFAADTNTITMDKIVPGDYASFNLKVSNASDVTVKYRTVIKVVDDNGLFAGLVATINNVAYDGGYLASDWAELTPGSADIIIPVKIELPEAAGNDFQGKTCTVSYIVEAVQGNGDIIAVDDPADLADVLATAVDGSTINLAAADFGNLTFGGDSGVASELRDVTIVADPATTIGNINIVAGAVLDNVTFEGFAFENLGPAAGGAYGGLVHINAGAQADLTFVDCVFAPNTGCSSVGSNDASAEVEFVNCDFIGGKYAFYKSGDPIAELIFDGCDFSGVSSWVAQSHGATAPVTLSVTNCTFTECTGGLFKCSGSYPAGSTFVFSDNVIDDLSTGHDGSDAKWFTLNVYGDGFTVENNVKAGAAWDPTPAEGLVNTPVNP